MDMDMCVYVRVIYRSDSKNIQSFSRKPHLLVGRVKTVFLCDYSALLFVLQPFCDPEVERKELRGCDRWMPHVEWQWSSPPPIYAVEFPSL